MPLLGPSSYYNKNVDYFDFSEAQLEGQVADILDATKSGEAKRRDGSLNLGWLMVSNGHIDKVNIFDRFFIRNRSSEDTRVKFELLRLVRYISITDPRLLKTINKVTSQIDELKDVIDEKGALNEQNLDSHLEELSKKNLHRSVRHWIGESLWAENPELYKLNKLIVKHDLKEIENNASHFKDLKLQLKAYKFLKHEHKITDFDIAIRDISNQLISKKTIHSLKDPNSLTTIELIKLASKENSEDQQIISTIKYRINPNNIEVIRLSLNETDLKYLKEIGIDSFVRS